MRRLFLLIIPTVLFLCIYSVAYGDSIQAIFKSAQQFQKEKKYDQAITQYDRVVDLLVKAGNKPTAQKILVNIGVLYFTQGKYDKAADAYQKALRIYAKPKAGLRIKIRRNLASAYFKLGDYAAAATIRKSILADKTLDPKLKGILWAELAAAYRAGEIYSQAVAAYEKALQFIDESGREADRALLLTSLGQSLSKLGRFEEAIISLQQANALSQKNNQQQTTAESYSNLGIVYWDLGQYEAALKQIDKALEIERSIGLDENRGADFNNRGLILKSAGKYDEALISIEKAVETARMLKLSKDEAIALSNRALVCRILGRSGEARENYQTALELYNNISFSEGRASCYLGLGKLFEVVDSDYQKAHDYYLKSLKIYDQLNNIGYKAEALNQLGRVLKKGINPSRTARDLVFTDSEPVFIELPPEEAVEKSIKAFEEALKLGQESGRREVIWSALQGLGFAFKEQGRLSESLNKYRQAVTTVVNIRFGGADSSLMRDYLKDKEELFTEAMEVCAALYAKTKDKDYLKQQMEFQEIYKNEVMKGAAAASGPSFEDSEKSNLFAKLTGIQAKKNKLDQAESKLNQALDHDAKSGGSHKTVKDGTTQIREERDRIKAETKKLDQSYQALLAEWKTKYPADSAMFDSAAKVDLNRIQTDLAADEALIQYFPLSDALSIICVTRDRITTASVPIPYPRLAELIRDDFSFHQIEKYGHLQTSDPKVEEKYYQDCVALMKRLHDILIEPISQAITDKPKLIIVTSKYLSYVPFAALVQNIDPNGDPRYLVYDRTISYLRLSFFDKYVESKKSKPGLQKANMLVVGNPTHNTLRVLLKPLAAAENEAKSVCADAPALGLSKPTLLIGDKATEDAWRKATIAKKYSIFYFATHGVPYAEVVENQRRLQGKLIQWRAKQKELTNQNKTEQAQVYTKRISKYQPVVDFYQSTFQSQSPLNGFLYMAQTGEEKHDGVLTLKEIMEASDSTFANARLAVLSACNTAVTYSPKISKELRNELESTEANSQLTNSDWTPGVDQISLTDTFMRRNFTGVLGTLWFADDEAAGYISSNFFKGLANQSPSASLRQAQLSYLKNNQLPKGYTSTYKHPFYWAVAAVFGD